MCLEGEEGLEEFWAKGTEWTKSRCLEGAGPAGRNEKSEIK